MKDFFKFLLLYCNRLCKVSLVVLLVFLSYPVNLVFANMSSNSYKIPIDSINVGGQAGSSSSYNLLDSAGEVATGDSSSSNYKLNSGFIGAKETYLSLSTVGDISMSPSIGGVSGGTGYGSMGWTVITDNSAGYSLSIKASTDPALRSASSSFNDYTPSGANPDYNWSVASTDSEFGFSPEGVDIVQRYLDNGSSCNTGSLDTVSRCWDQLDTINTLIAQRSSGNHPSGTTTTVKVQAESGANHIQPNGDYTAVVEVTLLPL